MRLAEFITDHLDEILVDWVAFAREQLPAAESMDEIALLDHARLILEEIAANMRRPQGEAERRAKSEGKGKDEGEGGGNAAHGERQPMQPARTHAIEREQQGFLIEQMIAEYRALRATVLRLWSASPGIGKPEDFDDLTRFNEAVDQAIAQSVEVFVGEVDKTRELFLAVLSHDLRGPLSTITMTAELLKRTSAHDARALEVVLRNVAHMGSLLDDLRFYTRQRLGNGLAPNPEPLRLDEFAHRFVDDMDVMRQGHRLELEFSGDVQGEWDPVRLHQALSNLVFNAVKYGDAGSPIGIHFDGTPADQVVISVRNTGHPIPEAMLDRIFDPLVRAANDDGMSTAQQAGANLGLGLYVVREIARAHGGAVEVTSTAAGTRFDLKLPRVTGQG